MKAFIVFAAVVASAAAGVVYSSPYAAIPQVIAAPTVYAAPAVTSTQSHAQDELGQYAYSYAGGPSAKVETKTFDGITRGGYSYIDANGKLQTVNYVSDALGFRVAATNLPVAPAVPEAVLPGPVPQQVMETAEVAAARAAHLAEIAKAKAATEGTTQAPVTEAPATTTTTPAAPVVQMAPVSVMETPEVMAARAAHLEAFAAAAAAAEAAPDN